MRDAAGAGRGGLRPVLGRPGGRAGGDAFICHVGYEVTKAVVHRLADGVDPDVITTAGAVAGSVPGVVHARVRARWTGRNLRVEKGAGSIRS